MAQSRRDFSKTRRGSNQYKTRYTENWKKWLCGFMWAVFFFMAFATYFQYRGATAMADELQKVAGSSAVIVPTRPSPTPTPDTPEKQQITDEIKRVFGDDAPKAFQLLSCENHALNPNAVNKWNNVPVGSRDIGVFQINEYWQKTQAKFLFNWRINIQIAHQLFIENGKSFKLWTCGRNQGI